MKITRTVDKFCTHNTKVYQQWLKFRKEKPKVACVENAVDGENIYPRGL